MGGCQGVAMWFLRMYDFVGGCQGVTIWFLRMVGNCGWLHEHCFAFSKDFRMMWVVGRVLGFGF